MTIHAATMTGWRYLPTSSSLKFKWDLSKEICGSVVTPTRRKETETFCSWMWNLQNDSWSSSDSGTYSKTISAFFPASIVPSFVKQINWQLELGIFGSEESSFLHENEYVLFVGLTMKNCLKDEFLRKLRKMQTKKETIIVFSMQLVLCYNYLPRHR